MQFGSEAGSKVLCCTNSSLTDLKSSTVVLVVWAVIHVMLLSKLLLELQAILYGLLCLIINSAFWVVLTVSQTPTTTPISNSAPTPKAVTPMLSLCAVRKGRGRGRDRGSGDVLF